MNGAWDTIQYYEYIDTLQNENEYSQNNFRFVLISSLHEVATADNVKSVSRYDYMTNAADATSHDDDYHTKFKIILENIRTFISVRCQCI